MAFHMDVDKEQAMIVSYKQLLSACYNPALCMP